MQAIPLLSKRKYTSKCTFEAMGHRGLLNSHWINPEVVRPILLDTYATPETITKLLKSIRKKGTDGSELEALSSLFHFFLREFPLITKDEFLLADELRSRILLLFY